MIKRLANTARENWLLGLISLLLLVDSFRIFSLKFPITDFSQTVVSLASSKNVDMNQLLLNYFLYAVPLSFLFAWQFRKTGVFQRIRARLSHFSVAMAEEKLFLALLLMAFLIFTSGNWMKTTLLSCGAIFYAYARFRHRAVAWESLFCLWLSELLIAAIPLFSIGAILGEKTGRILYIVFCIAALFQSHHFIDKQEEKEKAAERQLFEFRPFIYAAVLDSIGLLLLEAASLRGAVISSLVLVLPYIFAAVYFLRKGEAFHSEEKSVWNWLYLLLAFTAIPALGQTGYIDFFEGANHGVSISEWMLGTGLPILDNLDAHLLWNTVWGVVYAFITGDKLGALFAPPTPLFVRILSVLCLVKIFKGYIAPQRLFLILCLFPWGMMEIILPGLVGLLIFRYWENHRTPIAHGIVALSFICFCFLRIDIGSSFGLALLVAPAAHMMAERNSRGIAEYLFISLLVFVSVFLGMKGIAGQEGKDILVILNQFLTTFSSNQHWAVADLGSFFRSYWFYCLLPIVFAILLWPKFRNVFRLRIWNFSDWDILYLFLVFVFSFPRFLGRHTVAEHIATSYLPALFLLLCLILPFCNRHRASVFVGTALLFVGLINAKSGMAPAFIADLGEHTIQAVQSVQTGENSYWKLKDEDQAQIEAYRAFFDEELLPGETYFDFSNQSLFFAFTESKNPIYINQSPAMINSSKKGQEQVLSELKEASPRFVVMPYKQRQGRAYDLNRECDGILNEDRYYLLLEYIGKMYQPYCAVGNFAIWCKKSEYEQLLNRRKMSGNDSPLLGYDYEEDVPTPKMGMRKKIAMALHLPQLALKEKDPKVHHLGKIPYLWGNYASPEDADGKMIEMAASGSNNWLFDGADVFGQPAFLILKIYAERDGQAVLSFDGSSIMLPGYQFNIRRGEYIYRIRVSSDRHWYDPSLKKLCVSLQGDGARVQEVMIQKVGAEP